MTYNVKIWDNRLTHSIEISMNKITQFDERFISGEDINRNDITIILSQTSTCIVKQLLTVEERHKIDTELKKREY